MRHKPKTQKERTDKSRGKKREIGGKQKRQCRAGLSFVRPDELDPEAWVKAYFPAAFPLPFGPVHRAIISEFVHAIDTGERFAVAAPRGTGKSTLVSALALWALMTDRTPFPAIVPWAERSKRQALRFWSNELCFNARLARDYPDACAPFVACKGVAQRLASQTSDGEATGARLGLSEGVIVLPDDMGAIGSATINGNARGLNYSTIGGAIMRPSLAIVDDPQDRKTANSPQRVTETTERIDGDIAGMAGPDQRMAIVMCCTVIKRGDVAEHYLNNDDWRSVRVAQIVKWPDGWSDKESESKRLWDEWDTARMEGEAEHDAGKAALEFYAEHKAAMTKGMQVSWDHRFDAKRKQPDAMYSAMYDFYSMGVSAFMAERQNEPVDPMAEASIRVTPDMIVRRAIGPARGVAPEGSIHVVAGADINPGITGRIGSRITWAAASFGMSQSECVIAYGIHKLDMPKDPTPSQQVSCVYAGLNQLRVALGQIGVETLIYDARGWMNKGVTRAQALRYGSIPFPSSTCRAIPAEGWPHEAYRPTHKTAIRQLEGCHIARAVEQQQTMTWIAWNSDWFNLQQLRAWIAAPGAPGSCILYSGHHEGEFLQQITTRAFIGMVTKHSGQVYDWARAIGYDDYGDCLAMCRVGAAYYGIGTDGQVAKPKAKCNVVISRPSGRM